MKVLVATILLLSTSMASASAEKLFSMPYDAGKYSAKRSGLNNPNINVSAAVDGGYEQCSSSFGAGCDTVRVNYYTVTAYSGNTQSIFHVKCGLAKYTSAALKALPNGRQICVVK